jgi:hypothetical protein
MIVTGKLGLILPFNSLKSVSLAYSFGSESDNKQLLNTFNEFITLAIKQIEIVLSSI